MKTNCATLSRRRASGLTLVEAVLATALMGTLLASILIAAGRVRGQVGQANRRIEACEIAEELLAKWWSDLDEFPRSAHGTVPGRAGWTWRTRTVDSKDTEKLNASVVAIEVFEPNPGSSDEDRPAVCVEVLLPKQDHKENDEEAIRTDAG